MSPRAEVRVTLFYNRQPNFDNYFIRPYFAICTEKNNIRCVFTVGFGVYVRSVWRVLRALFSACYVLSFRPVRCARFGQCYVSSFRCVLFAHVSACVTCTRFGVLRALISAREVRWFWRGLRALGLTRVTCARSGACYVRSVSRVLGSLGLARFTCARFGACSVRLFLRV